MKHSSLVCVRIESKVFVNIVCVTNTLRREIEKGKIGFVVLHYAVEIPCFNFCSSDSAFIYPKGKQ